MHRHSEVYNCSTASLTPKTHSLKMKALRMIAILLLLTSALFYFVFLMSSDSSAGGVEFSYTPLSHTQHKDGVKVEVNENHTMPLSSSQSSSSLEKEYHRQFIQQQLATSELSYQAYRKRRIALVGSDPSKVNPWPPQTVMYFWDYFLPAFSCPYTIQRIGNLGDGGKWVCGMELFEDGKGHFHEGHEKRPCIIYSFGVSHESSFEAEFLSRTNCEIWAYDASVDRMGPQVTTPHPRVHFNKIYIKPEEGNATLGALMKKNGHKWIDFLKMDIESSEFGVMSQVVNEFEILPFAQLALEVHGDQQGKLFSTVYKMWEDFEKKGLRPFKNELNHWPCVRARLNPIYIEYSFINTLGPSRLLPN